MKKLNQGFTLIELVVVITIIGILAAIALPRYVALQSDARAAKLQAAEGAVKSAAALAKALCMTQTGTGNTTFVGTAGCNATAGANVSVTMDGLAIPVGFMYPTATATGIQAAAQLAGSDYTIVFSGGPPTTVMRVEPVNATTPASCFFTYTWAGTVSNAAPAITASVITGC